MQDQFFDSSPYGRSANPSVPGSPLRMPATQPRPQATPPNVPNLGGIYSNVSNLFSSGPSLAIDTEPIGELLDIHDPETPAEFENHVVVCRDAFKITRAKPSGIKAPQVQELLPCLRPVRQKMIDFMADTFYHISRTQRLCLRLEEHIATGTFPPEYASLKLPKLGRSSHPLHTSIDEHAQGMLRTLKTTTLEKQLTNEHTFLRGLKMAMSVSVISEIYKHACASVYYDTFRIPFTNWVSLAHIMVDHKLVREVCSREVNTRAKREQEKRDKLAAAQAKAAAEDATLTVRQIVAQQVQSITKSKVNSKPKEPPKPKPKPPKPKGNPKPKTKNAQPKSNSNPQPKSTNAGPKKKKKSKTPPAKHLKGSPPKGSNSTSFRHKTGGKN